MTIESRVSQSAPRTRQDPFGLRNYDFRRRTPESSEIFTDEEARLYIAGCDYPESVDELLLAQEVQNLLGPVQLRQMRILDAMCGPGRLGREFLKLGVADVTFHDGDDVMISHAKTQAEAALQPGQKVATIKSDGDHIPVGDNSFDLVISHNSTHQLASEERLKQVMAEFLRITTPGGYLIIADYQRGQSPEFLNALENRLRHTLPNIVPLLIPTFTASFSKAEFSEAVKSLPNVGRWNVSDAQEPKLTPDLQGKIDADPVRGHIMDYSPIAQRLVVQKAYEAK